MKNLYIHNTFHFKADVELSVLTVGRHTSVLSNSLLQQNKKNKSFDTVKVYFRYVKVRILTTLFVLYPA